jgi:hypothetical protein
VYELRPPAGALRGHIEQYWFVRGDGPEPLDLRVDVFVDGRADLVFNFAAPYLREVIGQKRSVTRISRGKHRAIPPNTNRRRWA